VGARPGADSYFLASNTAASAAQVTIEPDGEIRVDNNTVALDGITFKAEG
jgi:hypothetical protein